MAKRSPAKNLTELAEKEAFASVSPVNYNTSRKVNLCSLIAARIKYQGISGTWYEWAKAGSVVAVEEEDAPAFLAKVLGGRSCCGANINNGNKVFELV